jgi:hypothetical protein
LTQGQRAQSNGVGKDVQRWLDRLAKDRPDLLEEVQAGRLKPYAAARQAGIVKVPPPLDLAKRACARLGKKERRQLLDWLHEEGW